MTYATETVDDKARLDIFNRHRPRLFGLAYRMLGTRFDAEEILQDAYIRLHNADVETIENAEAWLVTTVTRLSIDRLRKASSKRETYIGPWLPEPLVADKGRSPEADLEFASSLSVAFMVMLERLSPQERAVLLLHDVFDLAYADIANAMDKKEPAVRQMLHRARERVRTERSRFDADRDEHRALVERFAAAAYTADKNDLLKLFSADIALTSDGGGKITAARKVITGIEKIVRLFTIAIAGHADRITREVREINGEPGIVEYYDGKPFAVNTFEVRAGRISAIYRVMNPDKLTALHKPGK